MPCWRPRWSSAFKPRPPISLLPAGEPGTPLHVDGRILGPGGPVANAALYVYQTDAKGIYSNAERDDNTKPRLKARFATDAQGRFAFATIMPGPVPALGPAGAHPPRSDAAGAGDASSSRWCSRATRG